MWQPGPRRSGRPGPLALRGGAQQLTDALIVNPNDKFEVAEAIRDALNMDRAERDSLGADDGDAAADRRVLVGGELPPGSVGQQVGGAVAHADPRLTGVPVRIMKRRG